MSNTVLLTYATSYGSTQEVAEAIAKTLRDTGLEVDVEPMRKVLTLEKYSAFILGAPLYMFRWHKDARRFLSKHYEALTQHKVAIFALGPVGTGDEKEWQDARGQLDKELTAFPWLTPVVLEIFGGKLNPGRVRYPAKIFMGNVAAVDLRDWTAIRTWASKLPAKLQV